MQGLVRNVAESLRILVAKTEAARIGFCSDHVFALVQIVLEPPVAEYEEIVAFTPSVTAKHPEMLRAQARLAFAGLTGAGVDAS
jgi:hypothetical protein